MASPLTSFDIAAPCAVETKFRSKFRNVYLYSVFHEKGDSAHFFEQLLSNVRNSVPTAQAAFMTPLTQDERSERRHCGTAALRAVETMFRIFISTIHVSAHSRRTH